MRDYSKTREEQEKYILSYEIVEDKIIAKLATGKTKEFTYTKENENKIIEIMEMQARYAEVKQQTLIEGLLTASGPAVVPVVFTSFVNNPNLLTATLMYITAGLSFLIPTRKSIIEEKEDDIAKMRYFLSLKEVLNDYVKTYDAVLEGLSKETYERIKSTPLDEPVFTINNLDNYTLQDIETIVNNIIEGITKKEEEEPESKSNKRIIKYYK